MKDAERDIDAGQVLVRKVRTATRYYIYDTYSNQLLETRREVWDSLEDAIRWQDEGGAARSLDVLPAQLREAHGELQAAQAAGYVRPCSVKGMRFYSSPGMLRERVTTRMPQLTLEVTEECTSHCRYCGYTELGDRVSSPRYMTEGTALNAVRAFLRHSHAAEDRCVSFWGGEPLLGFDLIRRVVQCVNDSVTRPVRYQFTSNAALINEEISTFLARHRVGLLVSLDGPQPIHDRHRVTKSGHGTYGATMGGLATLKAVDPEYYAGAVTFNCVLTRDSDLDALDWFFRTNPLTAGHKVEFSSVSANTSCEGFSGLAPEQVLGLHKRFLASVRQAPDRVPEGLSGFMSKRLQRIALRDRSALGEWIPPNACCVPFLKKMHVCVSGDVYLCEQWPHTNCVGNVNDETFSVDGALRLLEEYVEHSVDECRQCWACRLCPACFQHMMRAGQWVGDRRAQRCHQIREEVAAGLSHYAATLEECPDAFSHLSTVKFTFPV